jgi:hypothetical protein
MNQSEQIIFSEVCGEHHGTQQTLPPVFSTVALYQSNPMYLDTMIGAWKCSTMDNIIGKILSAVCTMLTEHTERKYLPATMAIHLLEVSWMESMNFSSLPR